MVFLFIRNDKKKKKKLYHLADSTEFLKTKRGHPDKASKFKD